MRSESTTAAPARQRILDAAEALFAEHGYDATTTKAVAEAAGVATGSVFYHYGSKHQLLETLLRERTFGSELDQILSAADRADIDGTLRCVAARLHHVLTRRRSLVRIMLQLAATGTDAGNGAPQLRDVLRDELAHLSRWLVDAAGGHRFNEDRAWALSQAMMASVLAEVTLVGSPPSGDVEELLDQTIDLLVHGIDPRGGPP